MKKLLIALVALISFEASADCFERYCVGYVEQLYIRNSGINLIQTSGDERELNCAADSGKFIEIPDSGNSKEILSVLLAAQLSEKKVLIRVIDNPNGPCSVSYVTLDRQ